jgi:ABC-type sugar transport system ATPase subunit
MFAFEAAEISKSYGGVKALQGAGLAVKPGSVHALLGENGAGKSTLVKVMTGAVKPDSGTLRLKGELVSFGSTVDASKSGVAVVSQELSLFPHLSVLDNIFTMREPRNGIFISRKKMRVIAEPILKELGFTEDPNTLVSNLSLANRQLVEIAKALSQNPSVLLLDEPTSALESDATEKLLNILSVLKQRDVAVIYISHILPEVMQACDEVTVLRNGRVVIAGDKVVNHTIDSLITAMVGERRGRSTSDSASTVSTDPNKALIAKNLNFKGIVSDVSFQANAGEIVGIAGLAGSGATEVLRLVAGIEKRGSGEVTLPGGKTAPNGQRKRIAAGVAFVSGDRRRFGLMLQKSVWENIVQVRTMGLVRDGHWITKKAALVNAIPQIQNVGIKASSPDMTVGLLSGGNQQKVVVAKWLTTNPSVILLDDPTRGVDVNARSEIHDLLRRASEGGAAVVMCSTDLEELSAACDRVLVLYRGRVVGDLPKSQASVQNLLELMNGEKLAS